MPVQMVSSTVPAILLPGTNSEYQLNPKISLNDQRKWIHFRSDGIPYMQIVTGVG